MIKSKTIGNILIIIGLIVITVAGAMKIKAYYVQKSMIDGFQKNLEVNDGPTDSTSQVKIEGNSLGIVSIPKIEMEAVFCEGVDMETLKYALGHFPGTAVPGEKGNCCIAGHRSYTYSQYFNRLDELKSGDEIKITTKRETYTYIVYDSFIVDPSHTEVLNTTKDCELTLVTCTPIRIATQRLIVKAKLK
ncbi:MAG: class D sortase [Solirubrobacterales bacterium]